MGQESGRRPKFDSERVEGAQDEHRTFNAAVGDAIRGARQAHGWTQALLAEKAGLSPNYVARLERGELGPSLFVAAHIAEALGIDVDALVTPPTGGARRTAKRRSVG